MPASQLTTPRSASRVTTAPLVRKASGLILEDGNPNGHGAIAGMSLNLPVIIGAENATKILKSGAVVTLDAERGVVSCDAGNVL